MDILAGIIVVGIFIIYAQTKLHKRKIQRFQDMVADLFDCDDEMQEFLRIGMYHKFKEDPYALESFVANTLENYYGGQAVATKKSNDFGVDVVHEIGKDLYLGQVKCFHPEHGVSFDPIALIHSQMQKQNAKGGYVATTSYFTSNAIKYRDGISDQADIELINGDDLCRMYIEGLRIKKEEIVPQAVIE